MGVWRWMLTRYTRMRMARGALRQKNEECAFRAPAPAKLQITAFDLNFAVPLTTTFYSLSTPRRHPNSARAERHSHHQISLERLGGTPAMALVASGAVLRIPSGGTTARKPRASYARGGGTVVPTMSNAVMRISGGVAPTARRVRICVSSIPLGAASTFLSGGVNTMSLRAASISSSTSTSAVAPLRCVATGSNPRGSIGICRRLVASRRRVGVVTASYASPAPVQAQEVYDDEPCVDLVWPGRYCSPASYDGV